MKYALCAVLGLLFASSQASAGGVAFASVGQPQAFASIGAFGCPVQSAAFVPAFGFAPAFGFRQQVFLPAFSPFAFRGRVGFGGFGGGAQAFAAGGFNARAAASVGGGAFFGRRSRAVAVTRTGLFGRTVSRARAVSR